MYKLFLHPDVPGIPGTPDVSDITATSLNLSWTAPSSDGGSPITNYIIEKKEQFASRWSQVNRESVTDLIYKVQHQSFKFGNISLRIQNYFLTENSQINEGKRKPVELKGEGWSGKGGLRFKCH